MFFLCIGFIQESISTPKPVKLEIQTLKLAQGLEADIGAEDAEAGDVKLKTVDSEMFGMAI